MTSITAEMVVIDAATSGDEAMRSNLARSNFNVDGTGVKIGTMSDSYDCIGTASVGVANDDLLRKCENGNLWSIRGISLI